MSSLKRTTGPDLTLRRILVHSAVRAGAARSARAKKLTRATDDLDPLRRGLGTRHYPDEAAVRNRLAVIGKQRGVAAYLYRDRWKRCGHRKPTLTWEFNQAALDAEAAADGSYALLTNLDPAEAAAAGVLQRFKGQEASERRYGNYKESLAVVPVLEEQPAHRSPDHRDLPGLAGVTFSSSARSAPRSPR